MKKIVLSLVVMSALLICSCGNSKKNAANSEVASDSLLNAETVEVADSIVADSIAADSVAVDSVVAE